MIAQNVTLGNTQKCNTKTEQNFNPGLTLIGLLGTDPWFFFFFQWNLDSGFQSLVGSGFQKRKFLGFWNPDSLTWGEEGSMFLTWISRVFNGAFHERWTFVLPTNVAFKSTTGFTTAIVTNFTWAYLPYPYLVDTRNITVHCAPLLTDTLVEVVLMPLICL